MYVYHLVLKHFQRISQMVLLSPVLYFYKCPQARFDIREVWQSEQTVSDLKRQQGISCIDSMLSCDEPSSLEHACARNRDRTLFTWA